MKLTNLAGLSAFIRSLGSNSVPSGEGILGAHLEDLNGRPLAQLHGAALSAAPYGVMMAGMNDNNVLLARVDRFGGLASAKHTPKFIWYPEGAVINTRQLNASTLTFVPAQTAATGLQLNPTNITTLSTYSGYTSRQLFALNIKQPLLLRYKIRPAVIGVANANHDFGFGVTATNALPTNGFIWRIDGSGVMPVLYINGSVIATGVNISTSLVNTNYYFFDIIKDDDCFVATCQDPSTGQVISRQTIQIPNGQARFAATHLPIYFRAWNGSAGPSVGANLYVEDVYLALLDTDYGTGPQQWLPGAAGFGSETGPTTFTTTSNLTNSTVAPTVTLSNTTPGATTLDGGVRFAAPAGAVTDYTLFGYTVVSPYRMHHAGVVISVKNLVAVVAGTPTQIDFYLGVDGSTSLITTPKRKFLGTQTFPVGSVVGSNAIEGQIVVDLSPADLITEAGNTVHLIVRISTGTATATELFEVMYDHIGYFE